MSVQITLGSALTASVFPADAQGDYARRWLAALVAPGPSRLIDNVNCQVGALLGERFALPISVTGGGERDNAYVVSPYTHYVSYLEEELRLVGSRPLRAALSAVVKGLGAVLSRGTIDRVVIVNNWLPSTNLYPRLSPAELTQIHAALLCAFPDHAFMYRSLNAATTAPLMQALQGLGYAPLISRRVYLFDTRRAELFRRKAFRQDLASIHKHGYRVVELTAVTPAEVARIVQLYNALYLDKYSRHNPAFNAAFVAHAVAAGLLHVHALVKDGRIDGVVGFFAREGVMTTPLLGYDTGLPRKLGLYRMLTALLGQLARERGLLLHRSSGAAQFKRSRGAVPELEYSLVYTRHLSARRRAPWRFLRLVTEHVGKPMIEKYDR